MELFIMLYLPVNESLVLYMYQRCVLNVILLELNNEQFALQLARVFHLLP